MQVYKVDVDGYYLQPVVLNGDDLPSDVVWVRPPQNPSFYRPKWLGDEWIEGATQKEIEELENAPKPLLEIEQLRLEQAQANSELVQLIMMMGGA